MDCREFQKIIPDIMERKVAVEQMQSIVDHVQNCKDCRDELEINYVLLYGLADEEPESLDIIGSLDADLDAMRTLAKYYRRYKSFYILIQLSAAVAVLGSIVYCIFKIWF